MEHRPLAPNLIVSNNDDLGGNQFTEQPSPDVAQQKLFKIKQMGRAVNCSDLELSTYLQALAAGYLPTFYSGTSPSVPSKSMSIASKSFQRGKQTVVFHGFPSLQMFKNSTESRTEELLTLWLAGFPARTYPSQERAQELPESDQECGATWLGWSAKYNPDTSSWKTAQRSLLGDSEPSSVIFPRSGMTRNGLLWELPMLERRTSEIGFGFWHTPVADDTSSRTKKYAQGGTPLRLAVKLWPTPTAHNAKETNAPSESNRNTPTLAAQAGGPLNADWTEWLMNWPIGWTNLQAMES